MFILFRNVKNVIWGEQRYSWAVRKYIRTPDMIKKTNMNFIRVCWSYHWNFFPIWWDTQSTKKIIYIGYISNTYKMVTYLTHIKVMVNVFMINTFLIVYEVNVMRVLHWNLYSRKRRRLVESKLYQKYLDIDSVVLIAVIVSGRLESLWWVYIKRKQQQISLVFICNTCWVHRSHTIDICYHMF